MNDQTDQDCGGPGENSHSLPSPPPQNSTDHNLHNDDNSRSYLDCNSLNSNLSQKLDYTVKYFDYQRILTDQGRAAMNLKMSEYEKAESENTTLHTDTMNFKNDNHVAIGRYNIMDTKTNSISDTAIYLNSRFTNISKRFNTLGDTVDNARTGQKYVKHFVSQTINAFQVQISNITDNIEDLLKQVNVEKLKAREELYILEKKYSLDLILWKTNSEQFTNEINNLKSEVVVLLEKLIEKNMMLLNKENEITFNSKDDQNALVINQSKLMNSNYDVIQFENQSLKDEIIIIKNSLGENKNGLDDQLSIRKDQTALSDMFKKDTRIFFLEGLEDPNKYLEKNNTGLRDCISSKEMPVDTIQEEKENDLRNMSKSYESLIKIQEEKLMEISQQLNLQREKENKINNEVLDLKQEIKTYMSTIVNLQDEGKAKNILITELKNKNDDLNKNLNETNIKLKDSSDDLSMLKNAFEKEKTAMTHQSQEYFKLVNELTTKYKNFKKKAKQLNIEVLKLRSLRPHIEQKKTQLPPTGIIEILSDCEENNIVDIISDEESFIEVNDGCMHEFNDQNDLNVSMFSSSSRINENHNHSNIKRNTSFVKLVDKSTTKKRRTVDNPASLQKKTSTSAKVQKNKPQQILPITNAVLSSRQSVQQPKDATIK